MSSSRGPMGLWKKSNSFKSWFHMILCIGIYFIVLRFQLLPSQCKKWVDKQVILRFSDLMFEIDIGVSVFSNLIGWYLYHPVGFRKGWEAGLALEGEEFTLWRLISLSRWSKAKFSSSLVILNNRLHIFLLPHVLYENVNIVFIEIYCIH